MRIMYEIKIYQQLNWFFSSNECVGHLVEAHVCSFGVFPRVGQIATGDPHQGIVMCASHRFMYVLVTTHKAKHVIMTMIGALNFGYKHTIYHNCDNAKTSLSSLKQYFQCFNCNSIDSSVHFWRQTWAWDTVSNPSACDDDQIFPSAFRR